MGTDPNFDCTPSTHCTGDIKSKNIFYTRGEISVEELLEFIQRHYEYDTNKNYKIIIEEIK